MLRSPPEKSRSVRSQVDAGCSALQLFDSWAGALSPADYREFVAPHSARVLAEVADYGVPRAHFGVGTGELLDQFASVGADVVGVDWRIPLDEARRRTGGTVALQGNLDPAVCLAEWPHVAERVRAILGANGGHPGHVFNLGHGVLPQTDPGILEQVVESGRTLAFLLNRDAQPVTRVEVRDERVDALGEYAPAQ